jgi:hypothetical protein
MRFGYGIVGLMHHAASRVAEALRWDFQQQGMPDGYMVVVAAHFSRERLDLAAYLRSGLVVECGQYDGDVED